MVDFDYIDSTAYTDNQVLDTYLLRKTRDNLDAWRTRAYRFGSWTPIIIDQNAYTQIFPRVCSYGQRSWLPFLWHKAPGVSQVEVNIRWKLASNVTSGSDEVTLYGLACTLDTWLTDPVLPDPSVSTAYTGGASSFSLTNFTLGVSDLPEGWIVVAVGFKSEEGTETEIVDGASAGETVYQGFYTRHHIIADAGSSTLGSGDQVPTWALRVYESSAGKDSTTVPWLGEGQQCLYISDDGSGDYRYLLYVYPPISQDTTGSDEGSFGGRVLHGSLDSLWYIPLGYADIAQITIEDKLIASLPDPRARLDAPRSAGVRSIGPEVEAQCREWLSRTRVHQLGPGILATDTDHTSNGPLNRISSQFELETTWQSISRTRVGRGDEFTWNGTNYTHTAYEALALFVLTHTTGQLVEEESFRVDFRLICTDQDGSSNAENGDTQQIEILAAAAARQPRLATIPGFPLTGVLLHFNQLSNTLRRTHLRSLWPEDARQEAALKGFWAPVSLDLLDDTNQADRVLHLQAKGSATNTSGTANGFKPILHLVTWTVVSKPHLGRTPDGTEIGV